MLKQILFIFFFLILITFGGTKTFAVVCEPCSSCAIASYGGPIQPSTAEKAQKAVRTGWEKTKKGVQATRDTIAETRQKITSATESVQETVVTVISWPFEQAAEFTKDTLGLNDDESKNTKAQDNTSDKATSVAERMDKNMSTYEIEKKGDYQSEFYTVEKRKYIRQQATIKLMARVLVLKNYFPEIEKLISKIDENVDESLKKAATSGSSMPESENEAKILKENAQLRLIWYRLLVFQKQIEAARLEFAANQALSNMKLVKQEPKVSSTTTGGK